MSVNPQVDAAAVVKQGAILIGDVRLGPASSVWYNSVLRADIGRIVVGAGSNIQDGCILHTAHDKKLIIGADVSVGHGCILHGCTLQDGVLVGMGSCVMDGAVLEEDCILGAGSLVTKGAVIPRGTLAYGRPAVPVRPLTAEEIEDNREHSREYARLAARADG